MVGQQLTRCAVTDETGFFNLLAMPRGAYEITAQLTGFSTQQAKAELTAGENLRVDFKMSLGQLSETVVVARTAALIETRSANHVGSGRRSSSTGAAAERPHVVELASTLPALPTSGVGRDGSTRGGPTMIVHAPLEVRTTYTRTARTFTNDRRPPDHPPPPDGVQEIRVADVFVSAEFGNNAGAQVTDVHQAGSNQFHGSAWEFIATHARNARNYFAPRKSDHRRAPVTAWRSAAASSNKLFYFGSYQKLRNPRKRSPGRHRATDPQRLGDFTGLATPLRTRPTVDTGSR